ncbi:MAG: GIY-YIG nuclease family protein [Burkholderiales bacterium]|nr:GIY-YIG nuclease family protein [Burkholderiales bacterium]
MSDTATGWVLYLLECTDGSLYAGITNDLPRRMQAHASGRGARYTRSHPPRRVIGTKPFPDRAAASRAEWAIKQLPRARKAAFLQE